MSAPKQLLRRGLDDGTERLRGQFRDASQRGQRDSYGDDQIEDAAWAGTRRAGRVIENLLKKKTGSRGRRLEVDPVPAAGSPETEFPLEAPPELPRQRSGTDPVRIKTREVAAQRSEDPWRASGRKPEPSNVTRPASEKPPHTRTEPPKIKMREYIRQDVFMHGDGGLSSRESPVPEGFSRFRFREVRQLFRRKEPPAPSLRQEADAVQPKATRTPPSPERAAKKSNPHQQFPDIKTKDVYLQRQTSSSAELPAHENTQGKQEFVQSQGRREAVKRAELRRSKRKNAVASQTGGSKNAIPKSGTGEDLTSPKTSAGRSSTLPAQGREASDTIKAQAKNPAGQAVKKAASKEKKAVKAARAGIKNSRQAVKTADRSAKAARYSQGARRIRKAAKPPTAAQKTAQAVAKAPQRTVKAARTTAKAGAAAAKEAAKASVAAIKAAIAAAQELIAAIAAGGWAVVAAVLVFCMVGLLIASPFGLFFAGAEGTGSGVPQAVAQLNGEFTARIEQIKESTPHDVLDLDNDAVAAVLDNWRNILAVYAVRASADGSSPSGLDGLTAEHLSLLREVFWDMNQISSFTETVPKGEDDTEIILHITAIVKTPQEMAEEYGFTDEQKELLEELLKPEYRELFQNLIGSSQDLMLSVEQVQKILDSLPDNLSEERRQVTLTAYQLLGKVNYFWGGKSLVLGWDSRWGTPKEVWAAGSPSTGTVRPYGLDCSGFVDWVFYNISGGTYVIGHGGGAHMQHTYCTPITWDEAIPGDLVFYPEDTHVGIVCGFDSDGNVQIIHCASGANNVVVTGKSGFTTIARPNYYSS